MGRSAQGEVTTEPPARDGDALRIDHRQRQGDVEDGVDHRFPIRPHLGAALDEHRALARTVEDQAMVAALGGRHDRGEIDVAHRAVVAVDEDHQRAQRHRAGGGGDEIARQPPALERDAERGRLGLEHAHRLIEGAGLVGVGGAQAAVHRGAVERMIGGGVEGAGAEQEIARARAPAEGEGLLRFRRQAVRGGVPRIEIGTVVALADGPGGGEHLTEIGTAIGDVGERPGAEPVVQVVLEQEPHDILVVSPAGGAQCATVKTSTTLAAGAFAILLSAGRDNA